MGGGRRLLNYRPLVFIAASVILSLCAAYYSGTIYIGIICFSLLSALLITAAVKGKAVTLALMIIAALFCFLQVYLPNTAMPEIDSAAVYTVTVRVGERAEGYDNSVAFHVSGMTAERGGETVKLKGDIEIELKTENANDILYYITCGDTLKFDAKIKLTAKEAPSNPSYYINITPVSTAAVTEGKPTFGETVRLKTKDIFDGHAAADTSALMYSVLFGDTDGLQLETYTAFRYSGLAHILAVSGLNVGLLAFAIQFILKKLKAKNIIILIITSAILLFYCYLCAFTPSVVRAALMFAVLMAAKCLGRRYDALSALAFSAVVILAVSPSALLSLSFKLSFLCMLSIIALTPVINKLFNLRPVKKLYGRNKFTKAVGDAFALSVAAQVGVLPLMINYFNYAAVYNILINIIASPFIIAAVYLLYGTVFMSLILPFMSFSVAIASFAFSALKFITTLFSYLPLAAVTVLSGGALIYALYLIIVFCGRFFMAGKKIKWGVAATAVLLFFTAIFIGNAPMDVTPSVTMLNCGYNGGAAVVYEKSAVYIGDINGYNRKDIKQFFFDKHIRSIDVIVLTDYKSDDEYYLSDIVSIFKPAAVYAPENGVDGYDTLSFACAYSKLILFDGHEEFTAGGIAVTAHADGGKFIGANLNMGGKDATYIFTKDKAAILNNAWAFPVLPDLLILRSGLGGGISGKQTFVCYNYAEFYEQGRPNFTYSLENDIITVK